LKKASSSSVNAISTTPTVKYLWIRLALIEKKLSYIIEHLVTNATRYYERDSLVADEDYGSILSSLLVGPCALDYTRAKTQHHFWTDPPADELVSNLTLGEGVGIMTVPLLIAGPKAPDELGQPNSNVRRSPTLQLQTQFER
jgi:RUN domain